jgi:hypothetical protein
MNIRVTRLVEDQGTIVVFEGTDDDGRMYWWGEGHTTAQAIVDALADPEVEAVQVEVLLWQIVASGPPRAVTE